ncbi:diguanylate cyclase [Colwellia sp. MSW7]|uniref:Diguanylate cyclase n=1 Tax=Colwellia maritima TaxID=2912588 RepID=A0ABS9X1Z1_9GAMM|nr:diguanylate cyclase [Colwellia maritima]
MQLAKRTRFKSGVLAANNTHYVFQLTEQRKTTIQNYKQVFHLFSIPPQYLPDQTRVNFKKIIQKFKNLTRIRGEVDKLINNNHFDFYSGLISDLLQEVSVLHAMVTNQEKNNMVSSLIYALGLEEYAAIERGLLYGALHQQHSSDSRGSLILMGVINHVARQQAELARYYNVASPKHANLMFKTIQDKKVQEYHEYESKISIATRLRSDKVPIRTITFKSDNNNTPALNPILALQSPTELIDPELWWESATYRLGLLHTVSSTIINDIITSEKLANKQVNIPLVLYTIFVLTVLIITILLSQVLKKRVVEQIKHIADVMKQSRKNKRNNQLLEISGQDEISVMANEFNQLMIERSANEEQLKLAAQVFVEAHDGIFITETDGTLINVNPAFSEITGYERGDVLGKNLSILNSQKQSKQFYDDIWESVVARGYWKGEVWNCKKNGELYAELLTISSLKDNSGKTLHYMGLFADITQIKNQHHTLEQMAHYDALTSLPNRTLFIDRFNQSVAHADRSKNSLAVCFIDLDNFKPINDNYGHSVGDKILIEVANRIKSNLRTGDTVSRQGGDEFALLLSNINTFSDCEDILKRIYHSLKQPFILEHNTYHLTASTGVTLYPNDHSDLDTLIRHADQAMYQIKLSGGNGYHLFNKEKDQQIIKKRHKLNAIVNAIKNDEFVLYYHQK